MPRNARSQTGSRSDRKRATRERILDSAGRLVRARGIEGTSVADVMAGADLTVGGFYAHFESKEQLVAESLRAAIKDGLKQLLAGVDDPPGRERLATAVRRYLSRAHRDAPEQGCPAPAILSEASRARTGALAGVVTEAIELWQKEIAGARTAEAKAETIRALATSIGGIALARALEGTPLSDQVLAACREVVPQPTRAKRTPPPRSGGGSGRGNA